ncbi:MAG: hypothetical protein KDA42_09845 [Planctomycetales bacterium]|nr:hypothetical protein [Planctomycetales bacterium]
MEHPPASIVICPSKQQVNGRAFRLFAIWGLSASAFVHALSVGVFSRFPLHAPDSSTGCPLIDIWIAERPRSMAADSLPLIEPIYPIQIERPIGSWDPGQPHRQVAKESARTVNEFSAIDRIFTEVRQRVWMVNPVLIVWCFDLSSHTSSMRERIAADLATHYPPASHVSADESNDGVSRYRFSQPWDGQFVPPDVIATSVVCFADQILSQNAQPVFDVRAIEKAIDTIPKCESRSPKTSHAILETIRYGQQFVPYHPTTMPSYEGDIVRMTCGPVSAFPLEREMFLILVSGSEEIADVESPEVQAAIQAAKSACRVYILSRDDGPLNDAYAILAHESGGIYFRCPDN